MIFDQRQIDGFPQFLKDNGKFCLWRYEKRDGKSTKIPYNPKARHQFRSRKKYVTQADYTGTAQSNNPDTFTDFETAIKEAENWNQADGIGIGFFDGLVGIDIDHCIDEDGVYSEIASEITEKFEDQYTEKSPSETGIHILCYSQGLQDKSYVDYKREYLQNNRNIGLEIYVAGKTNRFFTLTLNSCNEYITNDDKTQELTDVLNQYMVKKAASHSIENYSGDSILSDSEIIDKATSSKNGAKFDALYKGNWQSLNLYQSQSEADQALCNYLAFWSNRDPVVMDRIFKQSGLYREKWDRDDYKSWTIEKAIEDCTDVYIPKTYKINPSESIADIAERIALLKPEDNPLYSWDDIGSGRLFAEVFKPFARYSPQRKCWFSYGGKVWIHDEGTLVQKMCKSFADAWLMYAVSIEDEKKSKIYVEFVNKHRSAKARATIINDAQSEYPVYIDQFDKDPFLFNCQNGTLNLRTMNFRDHNPEDLLTKMSGVYYDPAASCPRWLTYIDEVMCKDTERADFFQRALGYSLSGDTKEECYFTLYGRTTRNGKGTAMGTFLNILGDYGATASADTIAMKAIRGNGNNHSEDLARLAGARFVNINEPADNMILSCDRIKELTGGDTITARYLYEKSFEYQPQFKIFINTNYLPTISDPSIFSSERVKVVPFDRHFEPKERDKTLKAQFTEKRNASGIFNWCLEGLRKYKDQGLKLPLSIKNAITEYQIDSDKIARFSEECLEEDKGGYEPLNSIYATYRKWCMVNGCHPENLQNFKKKFLTHFDLVKKRVPGDSNGSKFWMLKDYKLTTETLDNPEESTAINYYRNL